MKRYRVTAEDPANYAAYLELLRRAQNPTGCSGCGMSVYLCRVLIQRNCCDVCKHDGAAPPSPDEKLPADSSYAPHAEGCRCILCERSEE